MANRLVWLLFIPVYIYFANGLAAANNKFCVACVGPDKNYVCQVTGKNAGNNNAYGLHCIVSLAKDFNHQSCSVRKINTAACEGKLVSYDIEQSQISQTDNLRILPPKQNNQQELQTKNEQGLDNEKSEKKSEEPETLIELTDRAIEKSKKGINKVGEKVSDTAEKIGQVTKETGEAVSSAAKEVKRNAKTAFECLTSLFKECW